MTYIVSEDKKISGKLFQPISRSMDLKSASLSVGLSVLDRQTNFSQPASQ